MKSIEDIHKIVQKQNYLLFLYAAREKKSDAVCHTGYRITFPRTRRQGSSLHSFINSQELGKEVFC